MMRNRIRLACLLLGIVPALAAATDEWRFRVLLDERDIGFHNFILDEAGRQRQLTSEASFEVRMLFVTLYRYQHQAREVWRDDCLASIDSATEANGEPSTVRGQHSGDTFRVETPRGVDQLPGCVMSFAYWNPGFLRQDRLLNSQTGEYMDVEVSGPVSETLASGARMLAADRFRLSAKGMDIHLWYSPGGDWLALETIRDGRILRYERDWTEEAPS